MARLFNDEFLAGFWREAEEPDEYETELITDEIVASVEGQLGFKLPESYVELMRFQNGGLPQRANHRAPRRTSWGDGRIMIEGIMGVGCRRAFSLCGHMGSKFWLREWGYPEIGIYFATTPSGGHDMVCFDYRNCMPDGEPRIAHVDQEWDYRITVVAENFEEFARGLLGDEAFPE